MGNLPGSLSLPLPPPPFPLPWSFEVIFEETSEDLPEPLLLLEYIENASNRIGFCSEPLEAEDIRFIREHTTVYVPKAFVVYRQDIRDSPKDIYIFMERIHRHTLQDIWGGLQPSVKTSTAAQLPSAMQAVQEVPH
ncbi:hypothetical protein FGADI_4335 [Fusarium gaditjirri]|uniref:Uncharacterized protein n=1 Tax=Fusarium gaditjirri TaxID=282569 RepID=A0A8H4TDB5_9HYPO|nr:hypothetical protein FGADI_4335 [Fusarium gaditjirri]